MKKVKVIPPIFKDLDIKLWWEYKEYDSKDIDLIEEWFKKNSKDFVLTLDLFENIQYIAKNIGSYVHPIFKEVPDYLKEKEIDKHFQNEIGDQQKLQDEQQAKDSNKYILICNQRIDYLTIKILQFVWPNIPNFNVIKFFNNNFSPTNIQKQVLNQILNFIINPQNRIFKLFFEWNPISDQSLQEQFYTKLYIFQNYIKIKKQRAGSNIEFLVLRSNNINNDIFIKFLDAMVANPNANLKFLELYSNQIGKEGIDKLASVMETYTKFEYIGLAKNNIDSFNDIQKLMKKIGKIKMTSQMIEEHQKKEKEREEIIAKFVKAKKKYTEDQLPKLENVVLLIDGSQAILKNPQLKMLNLSQNNLGENDKDHFEKMQNLLSDEFQIVLANNSFDPKTKERIRKKLPKNAFF